MWPDNDTLLAFEDEKDRKMRIKDDTQGAFGDPDIREQFLQEFRAMRLGDEGRSPPKNLEGSPRILSGKDPPEGLDKDPPEGQDITEENAVRQFLHQTAKLDAAIVDLIVTEGGVTKLEILRYLTVEDLIKWRTPFIKAWYLINEAGPMWCCDSMAFAIAQQQLALPADDSWRA